MAANKRKIQANAQKYLQKGQLDKALKEYESLVQLDPRDSNSRLKVGDIHLRRGDTGKAGEAYIKVAEQFMKDGFDAKAVAIYKQVGKIDPKRLDIHEPLAELYQRLGLTSEALAALQTAADAYHKEGRKRDALELLRKMATLDPTNTTSRLKIADLLCQAEMEQDAVAEYEAVAEELERQGARDELVSVYDRILEIDAERVSALVALTGILVDQGPPGRAQPYAERLVAASPDTPQGHEFLAKIHTDLGREGAAQECYRTLAELYRRTGDDDRAREITQRIFGSDLAGQDGKLGGDLSDLPAKPLAEQADPEVMEQTLDLTAGDGAFSADAEQLLAEASVYLRYGKAERAIATLETLLSTDPDHRLALEKLGDAHSEHGDSAKAVTIWVRAAEIARVEEDEAGFATLRERIAVLDAAAAESLGGDAAGDVPVAEAPAAPPVEEPQAPPAPPADTADTADTAESVASEGEAAAAEDGQDAGAESEEVELEIDMDDEPALEEDDADEEIELDLDADLDADVDDESADDDLPVPAGTPQAEQTVLQAPAADATMIQATGEADATIMQMEDGEAANDPSSTTAPVQIAEQLEEADFYFEQNLFDEAEALYKQVVEAAPNHPQAMLRLGEIAAKRGDDPGGAGLEVEVESPEPAEAATPAEEATDDHGDDLLEWEDDVEIETGADAVADESGDEVDLGVDLDVDLALDTDADSDGDTQADADTQTETDVNADTAVSTHPPLSGAAEATDPGTEGAEAAEAADEVEIEFDDGLEDEADDDDTATSVELTEQEPAGEEPALEELIAEEGAAEEAAAEPVTEEPAALELAAEEVAVEESAGEEVSADDVAEEESSPEDLASDEIELADEEEIEFEAASEESEADAEVESVESAPVAEEAEPEERVEELEAAAPEALDEEPANETSDEAGEEASFDLAAELSDVFDGDEDTATGVGDEADDGFDAIFREFKKGVQQQLSDSDFEAHYDLGIAYREMGLLDDAVSEFHTALGSAELKLSALHMLGLCALDHEQPRDAAANFEQALSLPDIPESQQAALRFDLGRSLQEAGDLIRARAAFQAVSDIDPDYQDVGQRLAALDAADVGPPKPDVETFESFDDLIAEAESVLGDDEDGADESKDSDPDDAGETGSGHDLGHEEGSSDPAEIRLDEMALDDAESTFGEAQLEDDAEGDLDEAEAVLESAAPVLEAVVEAEQSEATVEAEQTAPPEETLELGPDAELDAEPEPQLEPEPEPKAPKRRRRKKISF